jgi:hypothetical protein
MQIQQRRADRPPATLCRWSRRLATWRLLSLQGREQSQRTLTARPAQISTGGPGVQIDRQKMDQPSR